MTGECARILSATLRKPGTAGLDQRLYQALFESTVVGINVLDGARHILDCNAAYCRLVGRERADIVGRPATDFTLPGDDPGAEKMVALAAGMIESWSAEMRLVRADGDTVWVRVTSSPISREHDLYVGIVEDLSERDLAEQRLRERTALLTHAQEIGGVASWVWYPNEGRREWSPEALRIFGLHDAPGAEEILAVLHPDDRDEIIRVSWETFHAARRAEAEYRIRRPDGEVRWVRAQCDVERDADGRPHRMLGVLMDVTERRRYEEELEANANVLARANEVAHIGSFSVDVPKRIVHISREGALLLGLDGPVTIDVTTFRDTFVEPADRALWSEQMNAVYSRGGDFSMEHRVRRADGTVIRARIHGSVELDERGRPYRAIGVLQDMTEHQRLEEQLRQAQKLDAVGRLASGVAHDFNNLLLVIGGSAQLALAAGDPGVQEELTEILRATERAGALVRQLLSFSRTNGPDRQALELNSLVSDIERMLSRMLEETIEVTTSLTDADTTVLADGGQLEQVLLNLAVNARDAMPDGGRLTIETAASDDEVVLRVADTGTGMDEATRERVFDPFFTTKRAGEGTGLGLSTVYGIVTNADGRISVDSEPGAGTTFTIALPHVAAAAPAVAGTGDTGPLPADGGEHILLVEDDPMVRAVATELLSRAGYRITAASSGDEALALFDGGATFDLVVSDLVMPKMTGAELSAELQRRGHALPTVYTSGYPDETGIPAGGSAPTGFVAKPFTGDEITAAVRGVLTRC